MKVLFIVNPIAGKGNAAKEATRIKEVMDGIKEVEYNIEFTERPGHAMKLAKSGVAMGYDIIYAVGGDGTVNEVMNGLVGTDCAMGVIPAGSGNDFARSLGIHKDTEKAITETINGAKKYIDIGIINERYFVNIASVGFDAEVVLATQKAKGYFLSGSAAYIVGLISTIFMRKADRLKMKIGHEEFERETLLVAVANGKYYGGGMMAAPEAILDDGLFDVCLIDRVSKTRMLLLFPKFMKGQHGKLKEVSFYKTREVWIESSKPISVNVDGEVFKDMKVHFKLIDKGLLVAFPYGCD